MEQRRQSTKNLIWAGMLMASCATAPGDAEQPKRPPAPTQTAAAATTGAPPALTAPQAAFQESYDAEAVGKDELALTALDKLPATLAEGYLVRLRRGWLLTKMGKHSESVVEYGKAAALEREAVEPRLGALVPLGVLRRWSDVETVAKEILARDPASYTAQLRLAFALYSLGRFPEAEAAYRKLSALYPGDQEVRGGLGWSLLKMGKGDEAARVFAAIVEVAPKNALAADGVRAAGARR